MGGYHFDDAPPYDISAGAAFSASLLTKVRYNEVFPLKKGFFITHKGSRGCGRMSSERP